MVRKGDLLLRVDRLVGVFPLLPLLQGGLGLFDLLQPLFPPRQFVRHPVAIRIGAAFLVLLLVGGLRRLEQLLNFHP